MMRSATALLVALTAFQPGPSPLTLRDTNGQSQVLLAPGANQRDLLFFVATDCPISNRYAPEIVRICQEYAARGVRCYAVYPDVSVDPPTVARHRAEYGFDAAIPAIIDRDHVLVDRVGPRVTPTAALYSTSGLLYRGRIDDLYVDVGRTRRQANRHDLRLALDATLAGRSISPTETEAVGCFISKP